MTAATVCAAAPARINVIGEHTDYNDGLVLPMNTALYTQVEARKRIDRLVRVHSATLREDAEFSLDDLRPGRSSGWIRYVEGVAAGLQQRGIRLCGAELTVRSDVPLGAGLSSSASLELSVARALLGLTGEDVPAEELALLCQRAEQDYAGVRCGIMDQYSLACAQSGYALMMDCRSLKTRQVRLPPEMAFVLTDSGVRHNHSGSGYNERAQECAAALERLKSVLPGFRSLRDLDLETLETRRSLLGDVLYRRCRHVLTDTQRVSDMVQAFEADDLEAAGKLLSAGHASLRDDFDISRAEVDRLVADANASDEVLGSRMTGGGFGGCVLSLTREQDAEAAAEAIADVYANTHKSRPWQHIVAPAQPAGLIGTNGAKCNV